MSWLYSQALVAEYLGESYLDGEPSALLNGSNTQLAYLPQDKMTDYLKVSRFGMMFKPLTEQAGEELLMSYQAAFRAKTYLPQEKAQELMESDQECGQRWQGLFARYDHNTHSLKTVQCSLLEDLEQSLQIWPKWGSMQNGVCYQQPMLVQTISEKECGLSQRIPNNIDFFHTPCTTGIDGGSNNRKALKKRMEQWPTPSATDGQRGTMPNWKPIRPSGHPAQYPLNQALRDSTGIVGKPNPMWVEWLMGWPLQWTDLKPLEMDKSHYVQQQHGTSLKED